MPASYTDCFGGVIVKFYPIYVFSRAKYESNYKTMTKEKHSHVLTLIMIGHHKYRLRKGIKNNFHIITNCPGSSPVTSYFLRSNKLSGIIHHKADDAIFAAPPYFNVQISCRLQHSTFSYIPGSCQLFMVYFFSYAFKATGMPDNKMFLRLFDWN